MTEWRETDYVAELCYIGWNPNRQKTLATQSQKTIKLVIGGMDGETHSGITRPSCSRVKNLFEPNTNIFNSRQLSILSIEELKEIADAMDIPVLKPEWVGANLVFKGIPHLSLLPPASRLQFNNKTTIALSVWNSPCKYVSDVIAQTYPTQAKYFVKSAHKRRGVTGFVECEGNIRVGMTAKLFVPAQPAHPLFSSRTKSEK